jgi:hypothetical protein
VPVFLEIWKHLDHSCHPQYRKLFSREAQLSTIDLSIMLTAMRRGMASDHWIDVGDEEAGARILPDADSGMLQGDKTAALR